MSLDTDLALMLADGEDTITIGSITTPCKVWTHDEAMGRNAQSGGQNMGLSYVLLQASQFPSLTQGDQVTVNGVPYSAGVVSKIQDGYVLNVTLGVN